MSKPGYLTDAELQDVGDGQRLALAYAPSWLNAVAELKAAFGFAPIITKTNGRPLGAYRTAEEQREISPGTPPEWSDHCKGRAVDITNQRTFRDRDQTEFIEILARNGWHNVQTSGEPFPAEPWHFANQSASPAGAGTPIEEEEMSDIVNLVDASTCDASGKAKIGTQCASILPSGKVLLYQRTLVKGEIANLMFDKAGPHIACTHEQFVAWTTEPAAGPVGSVQVAPMTLTGTITPA